MKALIIDPSRSYRQLLCSVLTDNGFDTVEVATFQEALTAGQHDTYELICMSVVLPDGDSHELVARIRVGEMNRATPVLMLTGNYSHDVLEKAFALGVTELFRKDDFTNFESYVENFANHLNTHVGTGGRILYVEDTMSTALVTAQLLEEDGHRVRHFTQAEEALADFSKNDYDIVLTDVLLEGELTGASLARAIRLHKDDRKSRIPMVAISAFSDNARRLELFRSGINDYVQKPILGEELLARVNNLVQTQLLLHQLDTQQKRLERIALLDQLTGLYNRHFFMEAISKSISQANRQEHKLSLLVIDIDHFKQVNDTHGHATGDIVLSEFAVLLRENSRAGDVVARYGGEEFVIILDHCDRDQAKEKAEKIRFSLENLHPSGLEITASFGVSTLEPGEDFTQLFSRADKAVYLAKQNGRNRVEVG